ncbi:OLC1v1037303C1 [Oldenlandia corymbosa var. corymbosa]|uniref:OLC1v1037303C1 n=1 Tax=Oldenlandia corymbosa var. corymbosa TaxID=529605 RepID=A0AAV1D000_OLDCO|nr:OLC1v1037303C1 [Oldenlandia corymbosa var. corymbosa]
MAKFTKYFILVLLLEAFVGVVEVESSRVGITEAMKTFPARELTSKGEYCGETCYVTSCYLFQGCTQCVDSRCYYQGYQTQIDDEDTQCVDSRC